MKDYKELVSQGLANVIAPGFHELGDRIPVTLTAYCTAGACCRRQVPFVDKKTGNARKRTVEAARVLKPDVPVHETACPDCGATLLWLNAASRYVTGLRRTKE